MSLNYTDEQIVEFIQKKEINGKSMNRQAYDEYCEELVTRCKRLVRSIANKYNFSKNRDELDDLIQVGDIAVIKAANNFNLKSGVMFSTYAYRVINTSIKSEIYDNKFIKIPEKKVRLINNISNFRNEYYVSNGYNPSTYEVATSMNINVNDVLELDSYRVNMVSLDEKVDYNSELTYMDMITDESCDSSFSEYEVNEALIKCLNDLNEEDYYIIEGSFGLNGKKKTLKELGIELGCDANQINYKKKCILNTLKERLIEGSA